MGFKAHKYHFLFVPSSNIFFLRLTLWISLFEASAGLSSSHHEQMISSDRRTFLQKNIKTFTTILTPFSVVSINNDIAWSATGENGTGQVDKTSPVASQQFATSAGRKGCTTRSDPSKTTVTCVGELLDTVSSVEGTERPRRLSSIAATENGVSTSAIKNPSRYSPPWSYLTETNDPNRAWKSLVEAVQSLDQVQIVKLSNEDFYLHAIAPTQQPPGLLSSTTLNLLQQQQEGEDTKNGQHMDDGKSELVQKLASSSGLDDLEFSLRPDDSLLLYRSASRTAIFVYPLTQPVSDGNTNLQRLEKIRKKLGWSLLGDPQTGSKRF